MRYPPLASNLARISVSVPPGFGAPHRVLAQKEQMLLFLIPSHIWTTHPALEKDDVDDKCSKACL